MVNKNLSATALRFENDLEEIALAFVRTFELKFSKATPNLSLAVDRWLDFRHRYVNPVARNVYRSDRFTKKRLSALPADARKGLAEFEERLKRGDDVNPYQGRGLTLRNDTSAPKEKARTDLLFADWGIHHFHLSTAPIPPDQYYSLPANYLAFCRIYHDSVALIDIRRHPKKIGFASDKIFRAMARSWPSIVEGFRIPGQSLRKRQRTFETHALREGHVNTFTQYRGRLYRGPGLGITSAGTGLATILANDDIHANLRLLAENVDSPNGQFKKDPRLAGVAAPRFTLGLQKTGLAVLEEVSGAVFYIPTYSEEFRDSYLRQLNEAFSPVWAAERLCGKD